MNVFKTQNKYFFFEIKVDVILVSSFCFARYALVVIYHMLSDSHYLNKDKAINDVYMF